jgi:hypothetical protein
MWVNAVSSVSHGDVFLAREVQMGDDDDNKAENPR